MVLIKNFFSQANLGSAELSARAGSDPFLIFWDIKPPITQRCLLAYGKFFEGVAQCFPPLKFPFAASTALSATDKLLSKEISQTSSCAPLNVRAPQSASLGTHSKREKDDAKQSETQKRKQRRARRSKIELLRTRQSQTEQRETDRRNRATKHSVAD